MLLISSLVGRSIHVPFGATCGQQQVLSNNLELLVLYGTVPRLRSNVADKKPAGSDALPPDVICFITASYHSFHRNITLIAKKEILFPAYPYGKFRRYMVRPSLRSSASRRNVNALFEMDETWYSVVFHGVPRPPAARPGEVREFFADARQHVEDWVSSPSSRGKLLDYAVLFHPDEFEKKSVFAIRLSFSTEAEADCLIKDGGYMFGAACRVSRYVPKPRGPSPTPKSRSPSPARQS
ncbi:hypothetical protein B0H19DRAFT_1273641 [Mycena capillaripes]|nr:hypothetical protein B0H19DRAFT_1273641 [Mycena capillaripes]